MQLIKQDRYEHWKYTDDKITIILDNPNEPFYFFENRRETFPMLMWEIKQGDELTLSHRTLIQALIGTGKKSKIMKIQNGDRILYSFEESKQTFKKVGNFTIYFALGTWIIYLLLRKKLLKNERLHIT